MTGKFHGVFLLTLFILGAYSLPAYHLSYKPNLTQNSQANSTWRFGIGTGFNLYVGTQMDYQITTSYGQFNELKSGFSLSAYKTLRHNWEVGGFYKKGVLETLKTNGEQGLRCDFSEFQVVFQKSLNQNILIDQNRYTFNLQAGIGIIHFKSEFYTVNKARKSLDILVSTVGYGYSKVSSFADEPKKITALTANIGYNVGYRINGHMSVYWENCFNLTSTSKLSGNLLIKPGALPDGYLYSGVSIYFNLGGRIGVFGKGSCPRFY